MPLPSLHVNLVLEQDGFLRAFDMSTVLWAAGYFTTLFVASSCPLLAGRRILELGAGLGAPSIAAAMCGAASVIATEKEDFSLVNVRVNAQINGASVETMRFDWHKDEDLAAVAALGPFDVVLGAGTAPHRWPRRLGHLLATLLTPESGKALLCQHIGDLDEPEERGPLLGDGGLLQVQEAIPGDVYGLSTRWSDDSEWEILVLSRTAAPYTPEAAAAAAAAASQEL